MPKRDRRGLEVASAGKDISIVAPCAHVARDLHDVRSLAAGRAEVVQEMQETWVRSLGQEDPLEKKMKTHSSLLAWEIPWSEETGRIQSMESQESDMTK